MERQRWPPAPLLPLFFIISLPRSDERRVLFICFQAAFGLQSRPRWMLPRPIVECESYARNLCLIQKKVHVAHLEGKGGLAVIYPWFHFNMPNLSDLLWVEVQIVLYR
jgi:hypothetical protein